MNRRTIAYMIASLLVSFSFLLVGFKPKNVEPIELYRVYLDGKSIGLTRSKEELEKYIDDRQESLKEKYKVDKIYAPKDLVIEKEMTYDRNILSTKQIYNRIDKISPFTIKGYRYFIEGAVLENDSTKHITPDETIYVLEKKVFEESVDKTIRAFVGDDAYDHYLNETQPEIKDTGKIIENVSIKNKITYREQNIPVNETIYTNVEDLSRYLLFGTTQDQAKYTVQAGDSIEDVAFNNKISTEEFLIANPNFQDANSLLFEGQEVTLGILQPKFQTLESDHVVELQENRYKTEIRYDFNMFLGSEQVLQEGQNGLTKITKKVQKSNGDVLTSVISESQELRPTIDKIIVRGGRSTYFVGTPSGDWLWPTIVPYTINSPFGYRWGTLHDGVDIGGCGYGSPIFASNSGVIVQSSEKWDNGQYITIDHGNGYYTLYAHLSARYVGVGQQVNQGDVIGAMGQSGYATGTHLHFSIWKGFPYRGGSQVINPMTVF